jgi:hypothetical protein
VKQFKIFIIVLSTALIPLFAGAQPKITKERIEVKIDPSVRNKIEAGKASRTSIENKMSSQILELRAQHKVNGGTFQPKGVTPQSVGAKSEAMVDLHERVHLYLYIPKNQSVATVV